MQYQVPAVEAFAESGPSTAANNAGWPGISPYSANSVNPLAQGGMPSKENAAISPYGYGQQMLYSADQTPAPGACGEYPTQLSPYKTFAGGCGCQGGASPYSYSYPQASASPTSFYPWTDGGNNAFQPQAVAGMENSPYTAQSAENNAWYTPQAVAGAENSPYTAQSAENNAWYTPQAVAGAENSPYSPYSGGFEPNYSNSAQATPYSPYGGYSDNGAAQSYSPYGNQVSPAAMTGKPEWGSAGVGNATAAGSSYAQSGWGLPAGYPAGFPGAYSPSAYPGAGMFPGRVPGVYNPMSGPIPYPSGDYGFQPGFREEPAASSQPAASNEPAVFTDAVESGKKPASRKRKAPAKASVHALVRRSKKVPAKRETANTPWINQYR